MILTGSIASPVNERSSFGGAAAGAAGSLRGLAGFLAAGFVSSVAAAWGVGCSGSAALTAGLLSFGFSGCFGSAILLVKLSRLSRRDCGSRRRSCAGLSGCARLLTCAGRAREVRGGDGRRDNN